MSRTGIVLQARASSSRLPGKVLRSMLGRPMLAWVIDRLRACQESDILVLATSDRPDDDAVAMLGAQLDVPVFRGDLDDVLGRFRACAQDFELDTVLRATGDNPFVDAAEADRLVALFQSGAWSYASAFPSFGSGLPIGIGVEIIARDALERSWRDGCEPHHREHVNEYIQENPVLFPQTVLVAPPEKTAPELSFTVDTAEQFAEAEALMAAHVAEGGTPGFVTTPWLIAKTRRSQ